MKTIDQFKAGTFLPIIAFTLVANIFLYIIARSIDIATIRIAVTSVAFILFGTSLLLLCLQAWKRRTYASIYYIGLFMVTIIVGIMYALGHMSTLLSYFYIFAVLLALLISLLDLRAGSMLKRLHRIMRHLTGKVQTLEKTNEKLKEKEHTSKTQLQETQKKLRELQKERAAALAALQRLQKKQTTLENQATKVQKSTQQLQTMQKENTLLTKKLKTYEQDLSKQKELKQQYSRTLANMRKKKKEEEELLVVSNDGTSVHRPKCIVVRNIPKESRKLIKNWKIAHKEGYKGCGLCKPHVKPEVVVKNNIKYKFVASKTSDKVHTVSCVIAKKMDEKDKHYYRTYKAALKKGNTACRVCIPQQ